MKKHNWIKISEFSEIHCSSIESLYMMKYSGSIPSYAFKNIGRKVTMIDENYFIRREEFKMKTINIMQEYYYYLIRYYSEYQIAKMLNRIDESQSVASWASFLCSGLFALTTNSIVNTKIPPKKWDFFRFTTWIIRAAMKERGIKMSEFDLDKFYELDERKSA